jgi:hypothetical protein
VGEPLKNYFGPDVPARIAGMIAEVNSAFAVESFLADVLDGYEALELTPRAWHIARALGRHLPQEYERAIDAALHSGVQHLELGPRGSARLTKTISLVQRTTRRHYPGRHRVELVVNGQVCEAGTFDIVV